MEVLFVLLILTAIVTVIGHTIWIVLAAFLRAVFADDVVVADDSRQQQLKDLAITEAQISRFYRDGKLKDETFETVMDRIRAERSSLTSSVKPTPVVAPRVEASLRQDYRIKKDLNVNPAANPVNPVKPTEPEQAPPPAPPRPPRKSFSEMLNAFMEESNIRWGEIIGGVLIIGCSTALVVSLWAQISQIPVLKFLIFTTVTAILFGIGLYTEHRWKLPTTSRGILTIATLLVPLNFLAIAAVSSSNTSGSLVIGSEILAPAIFLCLVYFAGRVITPGCAHLLSAGVLGSSVGQLLVRHFASLDAPPALLIFLGAFPVMCYVATVGLALRFVLRDREIDEKEASTVFTVFGTMSFAALLPFGLLLHKSGPLGMSMMYLAPIVTLWGLPMVATGTILWKRITNKELVASRMTGTALGILGVMIVLAGMVLAWPNPSSIVPAALLNFAIFTVLAVALEIPIAHVIAAICFALAYLVTFHVFAGNMTWVNLRVMSLLNTTLSVTSGQALVGAAALFVAASDWLLGRKRELDSNSYLVSACLVAVVSLTLALGFGITSLDYHALWIVLGLYSLGAFWIAWRRKLLLFTWVGSALLLFTLAHVFGPTLLYSFPWQTALFAHATICAIVAILSTRIKSDDPALRSVLFIPLNYSALISIVLGVVSLFQANTWEVTWMQAQRVYWIAGILLLLLWLNRHRLLFNTFQIALISALVLTVKAALQGFDWYEYLPLAFLRPAALQIQGTVLALVCLAFLAVRFVVRRVLPDPANPTRRLFDTFAVDRLLVWFLMGGFLLLAGYGSLSGVIQELSGAANVTIDAAGFPHREAYGLGSWIVLGLLLVTMVGTFWERRRGIYLLGAVATLSAAVPLLAGQFENQIATATAWRWLAAAFLILGSLLLWYRDQVSTLLARFGWPTLDGDSQAFVSYVRKVLLVVTVLPLITLTTTPALLPIMRSAGPTRGGFSFFGDNLSYGGPLVLAALVLIGYALRQRMPEFAFYAGCVFNLTVTLAFLLAVATSGAVIDQGVFVRLVQLNAITFAVYSLPWLGARLQWQSSLKGSDLRFANFLLKLQAGIAVVLNTILVVTVAAELIRAPWTAGVGVVAAGSSLGWLTLALIATTVGWLGAIRMIKLPAYALLGFLLFVCCLVAFSFSGISGWLGIDVLTVCVAWSAWFMLAVSELDSDPTKHLRFPINLLRLTFHLGGNWQLGARRCAVIAGALAVGLSLRTLPSVELSRWWSIGSILAITLLAATLNWKTFRRRYIYVAGALFHLAVLIWWFCLSGANTFSDLVLINLTGASLAGIVWLCLELRSRRLRPTASALGTVFSFHHFAAIPPLTILATLATLSFVALPLYSPLLNADGFWPAFFSVAALMIACLWDRSAKYAVFGLYMLGLIAGASVLHLENLTGTDLTWAVTMLLAAYTLFCAILWRRRAALIAFGRQFGIPQRLDPESTDLEWVSVVNVLALSTIVTLAFSLNLTLLEFDTRAASALAVAAQFLTLAMLAQGSRNQYWRHAAIAMLTFGMMLFGWSWLSPNVNATWLNRSVILMLEAFGLTAVYALLLDKLKARFPEWTSSARTCVPWLLSVGLVALLFCLKTEIFYQLEFGTVTIHPASLVAIGVTLGAAVVTCVLFALSPNHDPLGLSERGRAKYVYVAEVMLALLFLHIRLTMPWLFTGFIERYWPAVIMVISYFGVVASETLRRRKVFVLAHPLERTGAFLPILPVLGFWFASSEVDFSLLLFIVGGLYGLLSILRRSFGFGLMAAVAGNAGLWYMWNRTMDLQFLQHPQLWLIPVALSVLIAAYLNDDRLSEDHMTGIRYLSLVTIYVSSTADIFINGVANSPWLPLILGAFSLAGVFAGIVFRIRGLLLLGAIFLLLSIVTMIWYASANFGWTWLWYVAGIVTGATIIFMFAVFEKKRGEVLRVVDGLKDWDR